MSGLINRAAVPGAVSPIDADGPRSDERTMMITATSRRAPLPRILAASAVLAGANFSPCGPRYATCHRSGTVRDRMQLLEWVSTADVAVEGLGAALD